MALYDADVSIGCVVVLGSRTSLWCHLSACPPCQVFLCGLCACHLALVCGSDALQQLLGCGGLLYGQRQEGAVGEDKSYALVLLARLERQHTTRGIVRKTRMNGQVGFDVVRRNVT